MTKLRDTKIVLNDDPLPRGDDGKIDWERMVERFPPSAETIDQISEWSKQDPEKAQFAEMQIREFFERCDRTPPDPRISAILNRIRRRSEPATRSDVEDMHEGLQDMIEDLANVLLPLRPQGRKIGRPEKAIKDKLRILAGRWIGQNGPPSVRARLEKYLSQVAEDHGHPISKDTAQRLAQEAIDADRAHDPDIAE